MEHLFSTEGIISLLTLSFLEIVLGIDNIVFISITAGRLPLRDQPKARNLGIGLALVVRIVLLLGVSWIIGLTQPLFSIGNFDLSIRDIILVAGGLFLMAKSTSEIHAKLEGESEHKIQSKPITLRGAIIQIILLDMIFSIDSILTAIGLVENVVIIVIAIVIALVVMLVFAKKVSDFIHKHPAMKLLAISFLMMIGLVLVVEGLHVHVPKGYIYFAMAFSLGVELLNMRIRKKETAPVKLRQDTISAKPTNRNKPITRHDVKIKHKED